MWQALATEALVIIGWALAILNWLRVRELKRIQKELLRRPNDTADEITATPHRGRHVSRSAGALLVAIMAILFLGRKRGHWIGVYATEAVLISGWGLALVFWLKVRRLRRKLLQLRGDFTPR